MSGPDNLLTRAEALTPRLIEATKALVANPSETPPSDTRAIVDLAGEIALSFGADLMIQHERETPVRNLILRWCGGREAPRLIISCHIDTYPVGDPAEWLRAPFGEIDGGRFYGRGSADMKGGIAASLGAMAILAEIAPEIAAQTALVLAGDEEAMAERGTGFLIEDFPDWAGAATIVPDVGSPRIIRTGEKGMLWLDIEVTGKAAHSAHKHLGENAIVRLMSILDALKELETIETPCDHPARGTITAAEPHVTSPAGVGEAAALNGLTVNIGRIEGGTSPNLVAARARAELDLRLPQGVSCAEILARIEAILAPHGPAVRMAVTRRYEPNFTPQDRPIVAAALAASAAVRKAPAWPNLRIGASDARLWRRAGFDCVVCGLSAYNLGGADENFEMAELPVLTAILVQTALNLFTPVEA
ncbi:M20/M25/M40 family metallo-hydrolase [Haematobacter genomosp. 1]|uniref:Peptidase M20 n=1 Tax=Haematobacter genomosp. 1 TaxID=366618 RepID=A0A212A6W7_9RHOB|nr:M20/M25/M40 family metallo-hydrolase [Haematobacter genomosp. 1]OWJ74805.1 peptidase M20 [Haematobacter genomosp. 1]